MDRHNAVASIRTYERSDTRALLERDASSLAHGVPGYRLFRNALTGQKMRLSRPHFWKVIFSNFSYLWREDLRKSHWKAVPLHGSSLSMREGAKCLSEIPSRFSRL
jgi:hypothetical protein